MAKQGKRKTRKEKVDEGQRAGKKGKTKRLSSKSEGGLDPDWLSKVTFGKVIDPGQQHAVVVNPSADGEDAVYAGDDPSDIMAILDDDQYPDAVSGFNGSPCQKCGVHPDVCGGYCATCVEALNKEKDAELARLKAEVEELQRQAKARPFPTAPNGKGGKLESDLVGTPVRVKGRIGLVTNVEKQILLVAFSDSCGGAIHRTFPVQQCTIVPLDDGTFEQLSQLPEHLLLSYGHCL